jgi:hypothetical protein
MGIEYDFFATIMSVPKAAENPMLASIDLSYHSDIERFKEHRSAILEGMRSSYLPSMSLD